MKRLLLAFVAICVTAVSSPAAALDIYGVDLKIGVRGGPNIAFLPRPTDSSDDDRVNPQGLFYGLGWDVGGALQFRAFDIIGLEIGWLYTSEQAEAIIELEGVSDCSGGPRCAVQETGARLDFNAHHLPIALHLAAPLGTASPFVTAGIDFVLQRNNRSFSTHAIDPYPEDLDPIADAALIESWHNSVEANYLGNATLNDDAPERIAGIIAGVGLNIRVDKIEIPVEFRANIYPVTGSTLNERGVFAPSGMDTYDERITVQYNDTWNYQLFILVGLDYVIF